MEATIKGYEELSEELDLRNYPLLKEKSEDYIEIYEMYQELIVEIQKEDYKKALELLDKLEELDSKEDLGIEEELASIGE